MSTIGFVRNIPKFKLLFASVWLQKTHYIVHKYVISLDV